MGQSSLLIQIATLIAVTLGVVCLVELSCYWVLYRFRDRRYWLGVLGIGLCPGWLGGLALNVDWSTCALWGLGSLIIYSGVAWVAQRWIRGQYRVAIMMIAPAMAFVGALIIYPFLFQLRLAFAGLNLYTIAAWMGGEPLSWVGWKNFEQVLTTSPLQTVSFWQLVGRTLVWTGINVFFHVLLGLGIALLLRHPIFARGLYRTLLIIPWAMPQVVAILAWRGEFHPQFGAINQLLATVGISGLNWWSDPLPVFASCCIVNIWLGIPFMMIVFLGGLQAIPKSYYEAASIDGANRWTQFRQITLPLLKPVVIPSVTLGTIWTFNNINVIYLMTGQDGGNEFADILVSALYKSAFTYSRYSYSAAFAMIIFVILMAMTTLWLKVGGRGEANA